MITNGVIPTALLIYSNILQNKKMNRNYSKEITDGIEKAPARSMLRAVGYKDEDFQKPIVGISSAWSMVTPCNMHLDKLANEAEKGVSASGCKPVQFHTITISDGISMGSSGMRYSLVSREVIADSIETVTGGAGFDGLITIGGCDKNMPGCVMAMARLNRPSIFIYGGSIKPGKGKTDIVSVFEAVGKYSQNIISKGELIEIEKIAIPGAGACGGMYTANSMATAIEVLGLSLPGSSSQEAESISKINDCQRAGQAIQLLLEKDIKPSDILTKQAFENAITITIACGGSTNVVLHLLAIAHDINVDLTLEDFERIGKNIPVLADVKPSGKYLMSDLIAIGGVNPLIKTLLDEGLLHPNCITVTGKSISENLANTPAYPTGQKIIYPLSCPIKKDSHLQILYGNLALEGSVAKISGKESNFFEGKAKVFNAEEDSLKAILDGSIQKGDVVVIRYEGPKGGPGMREMLSPTSAIMGKELGKDVALITDGRFSGGSHGFVVGHISPEAFVGGNIAFVENGDTIAIDAKNNTITLKISEEELTKRKATWSIINKVPKKGVLAKYSKSVSSASLGAVTDLNL